MSLLPSDPDTSAAEEAAPRVIGVDSEDADDILSALTAETARELLTELHDEPAPPAELADRAGTSLQNAQYHLNKLEDAGAIEVVDTIYSEKGREMSVYAPADRPLVIFAGDQEQSSGLRAALSRLLSSFAVLALASLAVQAVFDGLPGLSGDSAGGGGDAGYAGEEAATESPPAPETSTPEAGGDVGAADAGRQTSEAAETAGVARDAPVEETATPEPTALDTAATRTPTEVAEAADAALSLPPGLLFFLGGTTALLVVAGVWYLRS